MIKFNKSRNIRRMVESVKDPHELILSLVDFGSIDADDMLVACVSEMSDAECKRVLHQLDLVQEDDTDDVEIDDVEIGDRDADVRELGVQLIAHLVGGLRALGDQLLRRVLRADRLEHLVRRRDDQVALVRQTRRLVDGERLFRLQAVVDRQRRGDGLDVLRERLRAQLQLLDAVVHGDDPLHERQLDVQALGQGAVLHLAHGQQDTGGADGNGGHAA